MHFSCCDYVVPNEPRKVKVEAINSTSLLVEWEPPQAKEQNGIIRGYQVWRFESPCLLCDHKLFTLGLSYDYMDFAVSFVFIFIVTSVQMLVCAGRLYV